MALLTKEQIKDAHDVLSVVVPVPEWGGEVRIQTASVKRVNEILNTKDSAALPVDQRLFLLCVVEPVFTEADLPWLVEKSAVPFTTIMNAIHTMLKRTEAAATEAETTFPGGSAQAAPLSAGVSPPDVAVCA